MEEPQVVEMCDKKDKHYCGYRHIQGARMGQLCAKTALYEGNNALCAHEILSPTFKVWFCKRHLMLLRKNKPQREELYQKTMQKLQEQHNQEQRDIARISVLVEEGKEALKQVKRQKNKHEPEDQEVAGWGYYVGDGNAQPFEWDTNDSEISKLLTEILGGEQEANS